MKKINNLFSEDEKNVIISNVIEYSNEFTEMLNPSVKNKDQNELNETIKKNILKTLDKVIEKTQRTTSPDELTSIYLESYFGHKKKDRNIYIEGYANQKKAEMHIGELLELYIQKECFDNGWCCTGTIIKDVDFVKKKNNSWEVFQIKNSDNTENNAASKVRQGTLIKKWVRRNSTSGLDEYINKKIIKNQYYWEIFPGNTTKKKLSEKGFRSFIEDYFKGINEI
jgi:hypothetical protein